MITKQEIDVMFANAVKAKVEKSNSLGTKAMWSTSDHLDVAAKVIAETVKDEVDIGQIRYAVGMTYNHSAFAQKLEKAFEKFGHFQREGRGKAPALENYLETLAKETAATVPTQPTQA